MRSTCNFILTMVVMACLEVSPSRAEDKAVAESGTTTQILTTKTPPLWTQKDGSLYQVLQVEINYTGNPTKGMLQIGEAAPLEADLVNGKQTLVLEGTLSAVKEPTTRSLTLKVDGQVVATQEFTQSPVREWEVYLLPHSHVDIGYTKIQTEVEDDQVRFIDESIQAAQQTEANPPGSQFKWNTEVLWAVDSFLQRATPEKREAFLAAVKKGWIELNGLYGNELTALCRPEELVRLTELACKLKKEFGIKVESAMISDVPGYTWGMVPVMAQSGIKYFSIGPNRGDRIGYTLEAWGDRPFYWVSPSGQEKVLCWVAAQGYSWFHGGGLRSGERVVEYLEKLTSEKFPYDIVHLRYNIGGDNGPPDVGVSEFVKEWNSQYVWPKIIIATASEMFHRFEQQYGDVIPKVSGDFTPYWEDGAASSSLETIQNRAAAERLVQAETLWSLLNPSGFPEKEFYQAWRNVILYDEHTWGAHSSISQPDSEFVLAQWRIKQAFAVDALNQSTDLLNRSLAQVEREPDKVNSVMVFNTCSWSRDDLVILPPEWSAVGVSVMDSSGKPVPTQRLTTGELAFLAKAVPPFAAQRYDLTTISSPFPSTTQAQGNKLTNSLLEIEVSEQTGAITRLYSVVLDKDLVTAQSDPALNDYFYVAGKDPAAAVRNGKTTVTVKEKGPLVASLLVESEATGCRKLTREYRLIEGLNRVDILNTLDKEKVRTKEGVHLGFGFHVPEGVVRMDIPWAMVRPEVDQLPGSCKNWFTVQRWVDISNQDYGVTWVTPDAPLVEVGAITAETPWMKTIAPSQTIYSYVMNNYWHTNYKADQEGSTVFRYSLQPHGRYQSAHSTHFGIESSQPLVVIPVKAQTPDIPSFLNIEPEGVVATTLQPIEGGKSFLLRLFGASGAPEQVEITWGDGTKPKIWMSDLTGVRQTKIDGFFTLPAYGMVTLQLDKGR